MNWLIHITAQVIVWTGAIVLLVGGLALTACIVVAGLNYVASRYARGCDIARIAWQVAKERKEAK